MTNQETAEAFLKGLSGSSDNMHSTGGKLFSYSTCIAEFNSYGDLIGNATKYSSTSSKHLSYIRKHIDIWTTKNVPINTKSLLNYL